MTELPLPAFLMLNYSSCHALHRPRAEPRLPAAFASATVRARGLPFGVPVPGVRETPGWGWGRAVRSGTGRGGPRKLGVEARGKLGSLAGPPGWALPGTAVALTRPHQPCFPPAPLLPSFRECPSTRPVPAPLPRDVSPPTRPQPWSHPPIAVQIPPVPPPRHRQGPGAAGISGNCF